MSFKTNRFIGTLILAILAGSVLGCTYPLSPGERRQLDEAEARWAARPFQSYAVEMRVGCFCSPTLNQWSRVDVVNGSVTRVVNLETGTEFGADERAFFLSVEQLFEKIRGASQHEWVEDVIVQFDAELGYPTLVRLEAGPDYLDAGDEYRLRNAAALP